MWRIKYYKKRLRMLIHFLLEPRVWSVMGVTLYTSTPYHSAIAHSQSDRTWNETPLLNDWVHYAKQSSVIFDVGGFNGIYGLLARRANPQAKVIIFEADPENAKHICRNIVNNALDIELVECAVSDHDGFISFDADGSTGSKVAAWGKRVKSSMLKHYGSPDLLKVDVEGHEPEVLAGADLSKTKILFAEVNHPLPYKEIKRVGITAIFEV